ncbi:purine-nucleoside phosphorylase [Proteinivorax tanatarense]|uniref:Purine nucleoside phosphorylase n=1 Tax=Proteinivorax tanatarense TaxID=1260629 RepID=A0AAU7VPI3_9FIRM
MEEMVKLQQAKQFIADKIDFVPEVGLILGSGLGVLAEEIEESVKIPYSEIPNFPVSTVSGHAGQLVLGRLGGKNVIAMQGRFHFYEGYRQQELTLPVRVMRLLGTEKVIITNAAGGVNKDFKVGQLMLIEDHINLTGSNPLIGKNLDHLGPRFPDMSQAYNPELKKIADDAAQKLDINLRKGVYAGFSGPNYETPSEIKMCRKLGADAAGMSTVPEVTVAVHCGMEVLGISCITNMAAGILDVKLDHKEVIEVTQKVRKDFIKLVKEILNQM